MLKWLSIIVIVVVGFLIILLGLGYLLKENARETTELKRQLDQEHVKAQVKVEPKLKVFELVSQPDENNDKTVSPLNNTPSITKKSKANVSSNARINSMIHIIDDNSSCYIDEECELINTFEQALNCIVSVNDRGANILGKIIDEKNRHDSSSTCELDTSSLSASCKESYCSIK